jgi:hypothetical protein
MNTAGVQLFLKTRQKMNKRDEKNLPVCQNKWHQPLDNWQNDFLSFAMVKSDISKILKSLKKTKILKKTFENFKCESN